MNFKLSGVCAALAAGVTGAGRGRRARRSYACSAIPTAGNEREVTGDIAKRFRAANASVKIVIDKVPYKAVTEQLPVQLAAGEGRTSRG